MGIDFSCRLDGKVVVVTGSTGVLGEAFVRGIAGAGARVVLVGRNRAVAEERAAAVAQAGGEALVAEADVLDRRQLEAALGVTLERFGRVDGLVNGAGGNIKEAVIMPDADPFQADLDALRRASGTALVHVTHDLGVARRFASHVALLDGGVVHHGCVDAFAAALAEAP